MKKILCIKLVQYCDKYSQTHGQLNVKMHKLLVKSIPYITHVSEVEDVLSGNTAI